ncbi:MAG: beta-phosphoglucomutase [Spirochaetales bacterium]|nr:beta-phosphoglucomutase [Spirochaetales bacterium]
MHIFDKEKSMRYKGLLFDLDGVIVDTAKYHFLAWKQLAEELGIDFTIEDNERLKGVSRMASFEIILEIGNRKMDQQEKEFYCDKKNKVYVEYIKKLEKEEILPGVEAFLKDARAKGYRTALGSASKNSRLILDRLGINDLFDEIIDGTKVSKAKPDPEVFTKGAESLGLDCSECIVFEDAVAGVQAAHNGGMKAVGIGSENILTEADVVMSGFAGVKVDDVVARLDR